jgi:hypothetical protein
VKNYLTVTLMSLGLPPWQTAPTISRDTYRVEARSVVMLFTAGKG